MRAKPVCSQCSHTLAVGTKILRRKYNMNYWKMRKGTPNWKKQCWKRREATGEEARGGGSSHVVCIYWAPYLIASSIDLQFAALVSWECRFKPHYWLSCWSYICFVVQNQPCGANKENNTRIGKHKTARFGILLTPLRKRHGSSHSSERVVARVNTSYMFLSKNCWPSLWLHF